jgi:hypothetical protein
MTKNLLSNVGFQLRLVKELRGRKIITRKFLADIKEGANDDHTLDLLARERSALHEARNYCSRSDERKGLLPGQFLGVVVTKFESDPSGSKRVSTTVPKRLMKGSRWGRKRRAKDTTTWLYYVDPQSKAFHVDAKTHRVMGPAHSP